MSKVLVTGGSGFLGGHCIVQLLQAGHEVRTTVRSASRSSVVRDMVREGGADPDARLDIVIADLGADAGWAEAVAGCDYVLHTASPFPPGAPQHEDELIVPAREGTLRVLRAARTAGVARVVLTSSFAAIGYGHARLEQPLDESHWSRLEADTTAYVKSKTLAERAAWDFIAAEGGGMALTTMLPVAVMGPVMGTGISGSNHLLQRLLEGAMPGLPNLFIPVVDVRDVASAHLLAMTAPEAAGRRFLLSNGRALAMAEIAALLRAGLGDVARRVPTRRIPDLVLRVMALFKAELRSVVHDLGHAKRTSNARAATLLGWHPRPADEAILAAARSMVSRAS